MERKLTVSQRGTVMPESPIRKLAPLASQAEARGVKVYKLAPPETVRLDRYGLSMVSYM